MATRGRKTSWPRDVLVSLIDQHGTFHAAAKALSVPSSTLVVAGRREGVKSKLASAHTERSHANLGKLYYSGVPDDAIAYALHNNQGIAYRAAKELGVSYALVINRVRRNPELKQLAAELKGELNAKREGDTINDIYIAIGHTRS